MIYFQKAKRFFQLAEDINMRSGFVGSTEGNSQLYGYNFGEYPIHKFNCFNKCDDLYPLYPVFCGKDHWHHECYRERRNSDTFAIEYVSDGDFIFVHNGVREICRPGEIFLVHQGCNCSMRCQTPSALKRTVCMDGVLLQPLLSACGLDRIFCIRNIDTARMDILFDRMDEFSTQAEPDFEKLSSFCYSFLLALAESAVIKPRPVELQKALRFMRQSLNDSLSLTELAKYAGVSQATLYRLFREYFHSSPINYFLEQKMEKAKALLQYFPVKQVAGMLNFSSPQYFSNEFRKRYGVSPKNFRCRSSER